MGVKYSVLLELLTKSLQEMFPVNMFWGTSLAVSTDLEPEVIATLNPPEPSDSGSDETEEVRPTASNAGYKVSPPTPMWYFFDSERELIKSSILPSPVAIKEHNPQSRIVSRLGDNAGFMLDVFLKVGEIVNGWSTGKQAYSVSRVDGGLCAAEE